MPELFSSVAQQVACDLRSHRLATGRPASRSAAVDRDAEWQRVNSYIADILKDIHVLYAKLARLQGDFIGREQAELEKVSEEILALGEELSKFSKAFYEGKLSMADSDISYGGAPGQGAPAGGPPAGGPPAGGPPAGGPPAGGPPAGGPPGDDEYDVPVEVEEDEEPAEKGQEEQGQGQ